MNDPAKRYVNSSSVARLRQSLNMHTETEVSERIKNRTRSIVERGIDDFSTRMDRGEVRVDSVADLERLIKLGLLVEGSATEITQDNSQTAIIEMSESEYQELSEEGGFAEMQARLQERLGAQNQELLENDK